jgi:DHA2 family multidrug resistance protein
MTHVREFWFDFAGCVTLMRAFWTTDADFMALAWPQILQGFAVPFFFIPLSNITWFGTPARNCICCRPHELLRTMAGAIGASIAVTVWDDHAKVARSEMVSNLHTTEVQNTLLQNGFTADSTLGIISNLVDKEAITMSANHVFLLFAIVFVFAGLVIWLCPKPKQVSGMPSH